MKKLAPIFLITLFLMPFITNAQQKQASIAFDKVSHDFGEIKAANGIVTTVFSFTNTGSEPLIISNVRTTCGCTSPSYTREPVKPGEKGKINVSFNPSGRSGKFSKPVTVYSNSSNASTILTISGFIISENSAPKTQTIEQEFRYDMGGVRFKSNHVSFGIVHKGETLTRSVEIINVTSEPQKIELKNVPDHLSVTMPNPVIYPNQRSTIEFSYNSNAVNDWDFVIDRLPLYVNGKGDRNQRLIISANIQEDFSTMSAEEKANAAKLEINSKTFDFGTIKQGVKIEYDYILTNVGKSDLIIRKIKPSCGCTAVLLDKEVIAPGESSTIKTTFNSIGKKGKQAKTITVVTNDPENPRLLLMVRGNVESEN